MLVGSSLRLLPSPPSLLKRRWAYLGIIGLTAALWLSLLPQPNYGLIAPGWTDYIRPILAWTDFLTAIFTSLLLCGLSGSHGGIAAISFCWKDFLFMVSLASPSYCLKSFRRRACENGRYGHGNDYCHVLYILHRRAHQ